MKIIPSSIKEVRWSGFVNLCGFEFFSKGETKTFFCTCKSRQCTVYQ